MTRSPLRVLLFGAFAAACASRAPARRPAAAVPTPGDHATTGSAPLDWPVPPEEAARKNPLPATPENLAKGRELFSRHCTACHGVSGRGDGPVAHQWARLPKDLTHPERQARMTDGEIFWKVGTGHRENGEEIMPALAERVGEEDRWRLVIYVRTLAGR